MYNFSQFPPDFTTSVGRLRKYIPDLVQLADPEDPTAKPEYIFSDDELQSFIDDQTDLGTIPLRGWHIRRAAADAMVAIANNENLILKKIVTEDLETDGPAVADKLLKAAALMHKLADTAELEDGYQEVFYAVPYVHTPPRYEWR